MADDPTDPDAPQPRHPDDEGFWPAPGRTSPPPAHSPDVDFTAPRRPHPGMPQGADPRGYDRPGERKRGRSSVRWLVPIIAFAVLATLAGGVVTWTTQWRHQAGVNSEDAAVRSLHRPAPPGWSTEMAWYREVSSAPPVITVSSNRVAFVEDGKLTVLDADSGSTTFRSRSLQLSPNAQPVVTRAEDQTTVGVLDGSTLLLWQLPAPDGAAGRRISLPLNARLYSQNGGLLVIAGDKRWRVDAELELAPLQVHDGHVPLGVTASGDLISAPETSSWTFTSVEGTPRTVRVDRKPRETKGDMNIAWSSRGVVLAWGEAADPGRRTVGFYDAVDGKLLAEGTLSAQQVADGLPLTASEEARYASAGPMLADLETGKVAVIPGWSTVMSNQAGLYGNVNGSRQFWTSAEGSVEIEPGAGIPWGLAASGLAIVMDTEDDGAFVIGGLRPQR